MRFLVHLGKKHRTHIMQASELRASFMMREVNRHFNSAQPRGLHQLRLVEGFLCISSVA